MSVAAVPQTSIIASSVVYWFIQLTNCLNGVEAVLCGVASSTDRTVSFSSRPVVAVVVDKSVPFGCYLRCLLFLNGGSDVFSGRSDGRPGGTLSAKLPPPLFDHSSVTLESFPFRVCVFFFAFSSGMSGNRFKYLQ